MANYTPSRDYYAILGIKATANAADIKRAYRTLIMQHHPDKQGGDGESVFLINEAYATLKDPIKRKAYDDAVALARMQAVFDHALWRRAKHMRKQLRDNLKDNASFLRETLQRLKSQHNTSAKHAAGDVRMTVAVYPWQAALGETLLVRTPRQTLRITLPVGANNATCLKIAGAGQPLPTGGFGDVYLSLVIKNPKTTMLTAAQRHAYQALKMAFEQGADDGVHENK